MLKFTKCIPLRSCNLAPLYVLPHTSVCRILQWASSRNIVQTPPCKGVLLPYAWAIYPYTSLWGWRDCNRDRVYFGAWLTQYTQGVGMVLVRWSAVSLLLLWPLRQWVRNAISTCAIFWIFAKVWNLGVNFVNFENNCHQCRSQEHHHASNNLRRLWIKERWEITHCYFLGFYAWLAL